jgi:hypothetical protein
VRDVSYSPALRWLFPLLLLLVLVLLSFGWKLVVQRDNSGGLRESDDYLKVAEFLVRQHFSVTRVAEKLEAGVPTIQGTAGVCRVLVAKSVSDGSDRDRIRNYATAADTVFVVFGGRTYTEQPTWLTTFDALWSKFRRELGFNAHATPVFVVIATKSCRAEQLPWHQLG